MRAKRWTFVTCVVMAAIGLVGEARALTDEELLLDLPFRLSSPGARALGLGGASIASADDSTAAESNPAALYSLGGIEFFADYATLDQATATRSTEKSVGNKTLTGPELPFMEVDSSIVRQDGSLPSYFSMAVPFRIGNRPAAFALSRQIALDVNDAVSSSNLSFALEGYPLWINPTGDNGAPAIEQYTISSGSRGGLDARLVNYNFGFSMPLVADLSFGVMATVADFSMRSRVLSQTTDPRGLLDPNNPRVDEDNDGLLDDIQIESVVAGADLSFAYAVGLHYHPHNRFRSGRSPIRLGLVYRKGAVLKTEQTVSELDLGSGLPRLDPSTLQPLRETFMNKVRVPDRWGFGLAAQLARDWMLAFDLERIEYSDLLSDFDSGSSLLTSGLLAESDEAVFAIEDATVARLGLEYRRAFGNWGFSLRGGYYNEPDHRIRLTAYGADWETINSAFVDAYGGTEDQRHLTGGFSIIAPTGLEFHFAADRADDADRYLMSMLWRLGRTLR